jgi:glyoxylase-like metal-dependent hydrolase (beta-lactamase superfamily II)
VMAVQHDDGPDWTEPGVFRVMPGVYRIPLPLPTDALRAVNVYAIENGSGLVLIDAGWAVAQARDLLQRMLALLGCGLGDVRRFLITHVHRDHYTQAVALRREFGGRVALGRDEQASLRASADPERSRWDIHIARLRRCGAVPVEERLLSTNAGEGVDVSLWEQPDEWIDGGSDIALEARTLHALPTPGHTRGHVAFVDRDAAAMFAGDHVLPHITPSIAFESAPPELPLRDYLESLRRVRELPDMRLLPAHGPVTSSAHDRVDELLAHHDGRLDDAANAVDGGPSTSYEAAQVLTWTRRKRAFADLDPFNQMLAVFETEVHLDLLAAQDRLRRVTTDGVIRYAPDGGPAGG